MKKKQHNEKIKTQERNSYHVINIYTNSAQIPPLGPLPTSP